MGLKDYLFKIPEHELFKILPKQVQEGGLIDNKALLNLVTTYENELYIWNETELSLNVICLKNLDHPENNQLKFYQTLKINNPPHFSVKHILCNFCGNYIALFGPNGICIVEKPALTWSYHSFKEPSKSYFCKSYLVDEHFFSTNDSLIHFKWHPGSQYGQKLIFLTSNNALRVYSMPKCCDPEHIINLCGRDLSDSFNGLFSTRQVLGEICVGFDFGDTLNVEEINVNLVQKSFKKMWPIYLLFENADVYEVLIEFTTNTEKGVNILRGPLLMYPPAEDNYGSDACSILYVPNTPPVLAIANQEGKIYNCLLISQETKEDAKSNNRLLKVHALPSLYVHERLDIEILLHHSLEIDQPPVQMQLYLDKICSNRYYCYHPTGLYSIFMPWLTKVNEILSENFSGLIEINENSLVKHLFCSKPFHLNENEYLIGFVTTFDHLIGCHCFCLTNLYQCHVLQNIYVNDLPLTIEMINDSLNKVSPFSDSLIHKMKQLFNRETSNPIIRGIDSATPEVQFELLCRMTQIFREEYIQRCLLAQIELGKNAQRLLNMKKCQEDELRHLDEEIKKLLELRRRVEKKFLLAGQTQENYKIRLEDASLRLDKTISALTNAEENMRNSLDSMNIELLDLKAFTRMLKSKHEKLKIKLDQPQNLATSASLVNKKSQAKTFASSQKMDSVHACLAKEMQDISRLVNQTQRLKSILDI